MRNPYISINQMADFYGSSESVKRRIIKQQVTPNKFLVQWYQLSKARIKKSIELKGSIQPILDAIDILTKRNPSNDRQKNDKQVSLEALDRFVKMKLPSILKDVDYEIIKPKRKTLDVNNLEILVAPDVVIKGNLKGEIVIGAIKIHISKSKPFDHKKSSLVASTIYEYLKTQVAEVGELVLPELCVCLDVFSGRAVQAPDDHSSTFFEIEQICSEIKELIEAT